MSRESQIIPDLKVLNANHAISQAAVNHIDRFLKAVKFFANLRTHHKKEALMRKLDALAIKLTQLYIEKNVSLPIMQEQIGRFHTLCQLALHEINFDKIKVLPLYMYYILFATDKSFAAADVKLPKALGFIDHQIIDSLSLSQKQAIKEYVIEQLNSEIHPLTEDEKDLLLEENLSFVPSHFTMCNGQRNFLKVTYTRPNGERCDLYRSGSFVAYDIKDAKQRNAITRENIYQVMRHCQNNGDDTLVNVSLITPHQPTPSDSNKSQTEEILREVTRYNTHNEGSLTVLDFYLGVNPVSQIDGPVAYQFTKEQHKANERSFLYLMQKALKQVREWGGLVGLPINEQLIERLAVWVEKDDFSSMQSAWKKQHEKLPNDIASVNADAGIKTFRATHRNNTHLLVMMETASCLFIGKTWNSADNKYILQSCLLGIASLLTGVAPLTNCKSGNDRTRDQVAHVLALLCLFDKLYEKGQLFDLQNPVHRGELDALHAHFYLGLPTLGDLNKCFAVTKSSRVSEALTYAYSNRMAAVEGFSKEYCSTISFQVKAQKYLSQDGLEEEIIEGLDSAVYESFPVMLEKSIEEQSEALEHNSVYQVQLNDLLTQAEKKIDEAEHYDPVAHVKTLMSYTMLALMQCSKGKLFSYWNPVSKLLKDNGVYYREPFYIECENIPLNTDSSASARPLEHVEETGKTRDANFEDEDNDFEDENEAEDSPWDVSISLPKATLFNVVNNDLFKEVYAECRKVIKLIVPNSDVEVSRVEKLLRTADLDCRSKLLILLREFKPLMQEESGFAARFVKKASSWQSLLGIAAKAGVRAQDIDKAYEVLDFEFAGSMSSEVKEGATLSS